MFVNKFSKLAQNSQIEKLCCLEPSPCWKVTLGNRKGPVIYWFLPLLTLICNYELVTPTVRTETTSLVWECGGELASKSVSKFRDWTKYRLQTCCVLREALKLKWCLMFFPQLLCKWPCWRDALFGLGGFLSVRNLTVVCKLSNLHGAENHNVFSSFPVSKKCNYHSFTALIMGFLKLIWMLSKSSMPACKGEILTKLWIYSTSSRGCEKLYPVRSNALYWSYRRDKSHGLKLKWYAQEKSIIILKIDIFFLFFY